MKTILTFCISVLCCTGLLSADDSLPAEPPGSSSKISEEVTLADPLTASCVLKGMISRLPVDPVELSGKLIMRRQRGFIVREVPFQINLNWGSFPLTAKYTIKDNFDRLVSTHTISINRNGAIDMSMTDTTGNTKKPPSLLDPIAETDITWLDISLSFLWWPNPQLIGEDDFRGTECHLIYVKPPTPLENCKLIKLWIDKKRGLLRQAQQFDENNKPVRKMWVSSVGKINNHWMIRNMEVKRPSTGVQTKLHVEDLTVENSDNSSSQHSKESISR